MYISINNDEMEVIESFVLLGSVIEHGGSLTVEIKHRLALGRAAMISMD